MNEMSIMCDPRLDLESKVLGCYISACSDNDNVFFPDDNEISAELHISKEKIHDCMNQLAQAGYIELSILLIDEGGPAQ